MSPRGQTWTSLNSCQHYLLHFLLFADRAKKIDNYRVINNSVDALALLKFEFMFFMCGDPAVFNL